MFHRFSVTLYREIAYLSAKRARTDASSAAERGWIRHSNGNGNLKVWIQRNDHEYYQLTNLTIPEPKMISCLHDFLLTFGEEMLNTERTAAM